MNWRKFLGSKKIFILSLLPSVLVQIFDYSEYLSSKERGYDGCNWVIKGERGKNYLDYISKSFGGWEFTIIGHVLFIIVTLLLLGVIYFLVHKKNKISLFLFLILLSVIFLFLFNTGRLF